LRVPTAGIGGGTGRVRAARRSSPLRRSGEAIVEAETARGSDGSGVEPGGIMKAGPSDAAKSSLRSAALWWRVPASFAQAFATAATSPGYAMRSGRASASGGTGRVACIIRSERASSALNG
jgi:hypothetical protein